MPLLILMIISTFALATTAGYFSVVGLAALFSFHFWGAVVMGSSLEASKIIVTSYLYRYWAEIGIIRKTVTVFLIFALMVLTSVGISGYLMQGYQEGASNKEAIQIQLESNKKETDRVLSRINDIEGQIANLPSALVKSRIALEKNYREEVTKLKDRYNELLSNEEALKLKMIEADSHLGPILYIAKELDMDSSKAALYLVLMIVVIFDPLTVISTISTNHIIKIRNGTRREAVRQEDQEGVTDREEEPQAQIPRREPPREKKRTRPVVARRTDRKSRRRGQVPSDAVDAAEVESEVTPTTQAENTEAPKEKTKDALNIAAMNGSQVIRGS